MTKDERRGRDETLHRYLEDVLLGGARWNVEADAAGQGDRLGYLNCTAMCMVRDWLNWLNRDAAVSTAAPLTRIAIKGPS